MRATRTAAFVASGGPAPAPTLASVSKSVVDASGGSTIVFTGTNLSGTTAGEFGVTSATFVSATSTTATFTTPAKTASATPSDFTIHTPSGSATLTTCVEFFAPNNIANLLIDLNPPNHSNTGGTGTWNDASGNSHTFTSPTTNGGTNATVGGVPTVHFDPGFYEQATISTPSAVTRFRVAINSDAVSFHASGQLGTDADNSYTPFVDGNIYDEFATHVRKGAIAPPPGVNFLTSMASLHEYENEADSSDGSWQAYLNGQRVDIVASGDTLAFNSPMRIGATSGGGSGNDVAREVWYSRKLATSERQRVRAWLKDKYPVAIDRGCNIRGYGHSVAAGGGASSVGTTDMYPRTIAALQAAAPGRYNLTYLGHPSEHVAQWMSEIATDITAYWVEGEVNILCMIELFNSVTFYAAANPSWTSSQIATQAVSDTVAWCAAVKAAKPWLIMLYMTYKPFGLFSNATESAALDQVISSLVALVGAGNIDAVTRLDQDGTLDAGFTSAPPTSMTADGTHPTDAGHQLIANDGVPVIEALYAAHA